MDGDQHTSITRHLADCRECALAYCRWRADVEGIIDAHLETPRPRVRDALRRRVEMEFAPSVWQRLARWWRRPIPAYGAVMATLVPIVAWIVTSGVTVIERDDVPINATAPSALISDYDATQALNPLADVL